MIPEKTISEQQLHNGKVLSFAVRQVELPDGSQAVREIAINNGGVAVVAVTPAREVRLVRQYRAASQTWVIELPAGSLAQGEDPTLGAQRELREETGDRAESWQKLIGFYSAPAILTEYITIYLATGLTPGPNNLEADEFLEVLTVPLAEALQMIERGEIDDAKTIIGLLLTAARLNSQVDKHDLQT